MKIFLIFFLARTLIFANEYNCSDILAKEQPISFIGYITDKNAKLLDFGKAKYSHNTHAKNGKTRRIYISSFTNGSFEIQIGSNGDRKGELLVFVTGRGELENYGGAYHCSTKELNLDY